MGIGETVINWMVPYQTVYQRLIRMKSALRLFCQGLDIIVEIQVVTIVQNLR